MHFYPRSPCGERLRPQPVSNRQSADFYPRSPCGERPRLIVTVKRLYFISIHALLAESDTAETAKTSKADTFLSTLSLRRATVGQKRFLQKLAISIHALLAESDYIRSNIPNFTSISIHALLAESDPFQAVFRDGHITFLSTLSLRRATLRPTGNQPITPDFYPRSPCGERLMPISAGFIGGLFLSTLSLRRATVYC